MSKNLALGLILCTFICLLLEAVCGQEKEVCFTVPQGEKGFKGDNGIHGPKGEPGTCLCNVDEVKQLSERFNNIAEKWAGEQYFFPDRVKQKPFAIR